MQEIERNQRQFAGAEGLSLTAECWGSPDAAPVLLFHGGGQTRFAWGGTAETLAREGWYAVSIDQRGHGDSDWSPEGRYHFHAFADDVAALLDCFERPPALVGASLGGIASLIAATRANASAVSALVLVDIATRMEREGAERIMNFMTAEPDGFASLEAAAEAIAAYNPHRPRPKDLSGLAKNLRRGEDGRYRWHWDPAFMGPRDISDAHAEVESLDDVARRLSLPTLLIRGRMSDLLSEEGAQHFLGIVPHARFADVSGAGHMVAGDRNDAFTRAVVEFLRECAETRESS
jgi:pimeloyl-ACP methyl ester carboxylesterase